MYIPPPFAETNRTELHAFMEHNSFATLISYDGDRVVANHLPLLLDRAAAPNGRLIGHLARANKQWQHANGQRVLVIFQGPHAYISPRWYEETNVVPTWNYLSPPYFVAVRVPLGSRNPYKREKHCFGKRCYAIK